jgi:hypothetical protein
MPTSTPRRDGEKGRDGRERRGEERRGEERARHAV